MQYEITIRVDTNDADYATEVSIVDEITIEVIKPLIEAIKKFKPYQTDTKTAAYNKKWKHHHNYPFGECQREDLGEKSPRELYPMFDEDTFETFESLVPYCEYGFHTIDSIEITPYVEKTKLL